MTSDDTIHDSGNLPAIHDTLSSIPAIHDEWDAATLAMLASDDGEPPSLTGDLRLEDYAGQAIAALHGDPAVLRLDPYSQQRLTVLSYALDMLHEAERCPWRDPAEYVRRAAVILTSGQHGTRMRCNCQGCSGEVEVTDGPAHWEPLWLAVDRDWAVGLPARVTGWKKSHGHTGPCRRVYHGMDRTPDWQVAGTEYTTCPACTMAAPRHAAKAPAVKAKPVAAGTRRQRPSRARKTVTGGA